MWHSVSNNNGDILLQEESVMQRDDFTRLNVTIHEVRTVVDRISTGIIIHNQLFFTSSFF